GGKTFRPDDVEEVQVSLYQASLDLLGNVEPKTPYLAKFCLPFCAATALRYGHVQRGDFTDARLRDADIGSLMQKIRIQSDPELTGAYPRKWPARVRIVLKDGRQLAAANEYPKGDPENPLSEEEVIGKFKSLVSGVIPPARTDMLIERVLHIDESPDIGLLLSA
ncbi:MAG: MmgE/PrpD family protein, partial [Deltaproteobacteria bacterium]|nr:MmgE/PrpD family protein [Deltaproteobacteria bacterium]